MKSIIALFISLFATSTLFAHEWTVTLTTTTPIACKGDKGAVKVSWTGLTAPISIQLNGVEVGRDENNGEGSFTVNSVAGGINAFTVSEDPAIVIPGTTPHSKTMYDTLAEPAALQMTSKTMVAAQAGQSNGSLFIEVNGGTLPYSYSWNTNPVQTTATATNIPAGSYTLTLRDAHACLFEQTEPVNEEVISGIRETSANSVRMYPNPGLSGNTCIQIPSNFSQGMISIFSMTGQLLAQLPARAGNSYTLPALAAGMYLVQVSEASKLIYQERLLVR